MNLRSVNDALIASFLTFSRKILWLLWVQRMSASEIIHKSQRVAISARVGKIVGDAGGAVSKRNSRSIEVDFDDVCMRPVSGEFQFYKGSGVLVVGGQYELRHSLLVSMNARSLDAVRDRWQSLLPIDEGRNEVRADGPIYISCNEGSGTWGHWLVHNFPRVVMFLDRFPDGRVVLPRDYLGARYKGCLDLLLLYGYEPDRFLFVGQNDVVCGNRLFLVDLPYKLEVAHPCVLDVYKSVRERIIESTGGLSADPASLVYVCRQGGREVANDGVVRSVVANMGGRTDMTSGLIVEQARSWSSSSSVLSVLGSDMTNMLLGNAERLFSLSPSWFGDSFFYWIAAALGIEWNEYYCDRIGEERTPKHRSSFFVDEAILSGFLNG